LGEETRGGVVLYSCGPVVITVLFVVCLEESELRLLMKEVKVEMRNRVRRVVLWTELKLDLTESTCSERCF
jgi:hypothetical protein